MQLGMIGLGRMGRNMARRLKRAGHECVVYDRNEETVQQLADEGFRGARSLAELTTALKPPRTTWLMVPAGDVTEKVANDVAEHLASGDAVVDGGNSYFKDSVRRGRRLGVRGIRFVDVGTSGGVWGLERGYCLMVGGDPMTVERLSPVFDALAPGKGSIERTPGRDGPPSTAERGWLHCGPSGAGHFVKMIHNGIEYGVMQAYAEGFDILRGAQSEEVKPEHRYAIDLREVSELWRRGSVIGSWLLDLTAQALVEDPNLDRYSGFVQDSGEGRWTVQTAVEQATCADVLTAALYARFRSRQEHTFAEKVLSAMRAKFGGHQEPPR